MKAVRKNNFERLKRASLVLCFGSALWLAGCSGGNVEQQRAQQSQQLAQLREENKEVQKLRVENKELPRLRKDNAEIPQLRGQADEIEKLRKDNDRIKNEIADLGKARRQSQQAALQAQQAQQAAAALAQARGALQSGATNAFDPNIPQEGDELYVDPKFLAKILPEFDWSKLQRKEPVNVKGLLEQQGIVLTNYQQLIELGITNYSVRHAPKQIAPAAAPVPP
jgi:flagellar biosynthesis GTPase FlhF